MPLKFKQKSIVFNLVELTRCDCVTNPNSNPTDLKHKIRIWRKF